MTWSMTSAPLGIYFSIASDSTGQYLAAASMGYGSTQAGYIYISTNG